MKGILILIVKYTIRIKIPLTFNLNVMLYLKMYTPVLVGMLIMHGEENFNTKLKAHILLSLMNKVL